MERGVPEAHGQNTAKLHHVAFLNQETNAVPKVVIPSRKPNAPFQEELLEPKRRTHQDSDRAQANC